MSKWNRPMVRYKAPPAGPKARNLERIQPGLWRHVPTGRLIVKQSDGTWVLAWDTSHGVLPEGRCYRTMRHAVRALTSGTVIVT